eukprot:CAMPEP_0175989172 /NCGR_PEP_ID=MMETSP0108-20121206/51628_1 /TAXON_ID=195067 ORGANISM="Goniomonas pacifica, Strain CCMP1869" /NCGR_SAMPLE_ID=MMETSP0108 /ASSEMBLY_ACC=CAM_ASM_000204 /LENGTH=65 /DNA_ID=CAMNT_0017320553 /DNA_START=125 /DNA_END=322 /DNA_ORIENTATION=+
MTSPERQRRQHPTEPRPRDKHDDAENKPGHETTGVYPEPPLARGTPRRGSNLGNTCFHVCVSCNV